MQRKLERTVHCVRFATKQGPGKIRVVCLKEDEVGDDWEDATEWIRSNYHGKLYGYIEQEDDDS